MSELDNLPLSQLIKYYKLAVDWIKAKSGLDK